MRIILAVLLSLLGPLLAPACAQAPPPVPALPDTERRTTYVITANTGPFDVGFQVYGDGTDFGAWIEVWLNGVMLSPAQWTLSLATGTLATAARPLQNARVTLATASTGTVQIVGARRPRRTSQFTENQGVSARNLNQALTDVVAQNRETWDKINDVSGRTILVPPGETLRVLPPATSRVGQLLGFDTNGQPVMSTGTTTVTTIGTGMIAYPTRAAAQVATIPAAVGVVILNGYSALGDAPPIQYLRTALACNVGWRFQSSDGQCWEIAGNSVYWQHLGAKGDGVIDDTQAMYDTCDFIAYKSGGKISSLPHKQYVIETAAHSLANRSSMCSFDGTAFGIDVTMNGSAIRVGHQYTNVGDPLLNVTNATAGTGGVVRLTLLNTVGYYTGDQVAVSGIVGTTEANGNWIINLIDATHVDLVGTTFVNAYAGGGSTSNNYSLYFVWYCHPCYYFNIDQIIVFQSPFPNTRGVGGLINRPNTGTIPIAVSGAGTGIQIGMTICSGGYSAFFQASALGDPYSVENVNTIVGSAQSVGGTNYGVVVTGGINLRVGEIRTDSVARSLFIWGAINTYIGSIVSVNGDANDVLIEDHPEVIHETNGLTIGNYTGKSVGPVNYQPISITVVHNNTFVKNVSVNFNLDLTGAGNVTGFIIQKTGGSGQTVDGVTVSCNVANAAGSNVSVLDLFNVGDWSTATARNIAINNCYSSGSSAQLGIRANLLPLGTAPGNLSMSNVHLAGASIFTNSGSPTVLSMMNVSFAGVPYGNGQYVASVCGTQNSTVTMTIASPAVITWPAHPFNNTNGRYDACPVLFTTTGALPTGITAGATYWVIPSSITTNTLSVATTVANAINGVAVNTSGTQSGTHTGFGANALVSTSRQDVTGISLPPGDWDVSGLIATTPGAGTTVSLAEGWTSTVSANTVNPPNNNAFTAFPSAPANVRISMPIGTQQLRLTATTIVYLSAQFTFAVSTLNDYGSIRARRMQ